MTETVPFESIKGQPLSSEQRSYLEGIFAGLRNRGVSFGDVEPAPSAAQSSPVDLIAEERIKRELHPLDAYGLLVEDATTNKAPDKENIFRFKWHGLFYLTPHKEAFMARLRIPGGVLKSFQARELARISSELTSGYLQITTRANIQLRLIEPKDAPAVLTRVQSVGLHSRGAGADNIRNITINATAGLDSNELIDTLPFCRELAQIIINNREFYNLPRKFNIAYDGGGLASSLEDTNDIGARAVKVTVPVPGVECDVAFRLAVGGATGHKSFAQDLGVLVPPALVNKAIIALLRVYIAKGDRSNRKRARLKHLLEKWSLAQYLEEAEKLLGFKLPRAPLEERSETAQPSETLGGGLQAHLGAHPQKQPGLNWIGVAVPVGELTPKQLSRLADLAENYGSGELRLTVWQNLIIPNVPDAFVETLKKAVVKLGLDWRASHLRSGLVACTGNSYCKFASANTKRHAREIADYLEKQVELDQPINIHLTGCPNSCAQHNIGDIGLLGTQVKVEGEPREGYHVFVGGGFGANATIGRQVFQGISIEQLKPTLARVLQAYLQHRSPGESFRAFTTRHDLNTLQRLFT